MNSTLLKVNGERVDVAPKNGKDYKIEELQGFVGGYIEIIRLSQSQIMVVNEEGAINGMRVNNNASLAVSMVFGFHYPIFGDVLVCPDEMVK